MKNNPSCDSEKETALPIGISLNIKRSSYEETQNPVFALQGFILSRQKKAGVPEWVMRWLQRGFEEYLESRGGEDLGKLLGFKRQRGKRSAFTEAILIERNNRLVKEVIRLRVSLGLLKKQASFQMSKGEEIGTKRISQLCSKKETLKRRLHGC
jgi:hypothetical protein